MRSVIFIKGLQILTHPEKKNVEQNLNCSQKNIIKIKYIKVYIKAGSTFLQNATDTSKICRLNIKLYSES